MPLTKLLGQALSICGACVALYGASALATPGRPLSEPELAAIKATVLPDGAGLPVGSGTAGAGRAVYARHCQACHGPEGRGGINDVLAGGQGTLASTQPQKTLGSYWPRATTVFDYVRRAMPYPTPGILSADELYAVTAYLLYLNDIIGEQVTLDADSLPQVVMPNAEGFESAWPLGPVGVSPTSDE